MNDIQQLFQSEDGNKEQRNAILHQIEKILTAMDLLKNPNKAFLGEKKVYSPTLYLDFMENSTVPTTGSSLDMVVEELTELMQGHPYVSHNFVSNVMPMASVPGILGMLTTTLLNGNNLWDVYGPAGAECEVKVISMMSKLVGYDFTKSYGYTTWGGQGAVFSGLRLAIAKQFPHAKEEGVPNNLYCFASENAHYSLLKSVEAVGIGSNNLIRIKADKDLTMDMEDLQARLEEVIAKGGIPVYILATTGATDHFAIDDVSIIKKIATEIEEKHQLKPIHIHADSALGGFYAFFNDYDYTLNPLHFEADVFEGLQQITEKMRHISLADSLCFDFQKLGQTPYLTSLFLVKDGQSLGLLDLDDFETPYVGNRGYGSYHTGYTLECSRMGSSITIYAALQAFGKEGYQKILANYVRVNVAFRKQLKQSNLPLEVVNPHNIGPVTVFRYYPTGFDWDKEQGGLMTKEQITHVNQLNNQLFEILGENRDTVFFGDTTRICTVKAQDTNDFVPVAAAKVFSISPYTEVKHIPTIIESLEYGLKHLQPVATVSM
ncbi:pyridoxal phosphate-dependent decarboxylase family protein [Lysinibacillus sp. NPDC097287]|uniref:pyridoxal phosphate-dependent decarboxylase family protein n=1 Tax=Lysinibacillus sp. NPDC097287 TaxID=3364144 RepID=UPI00380F5C53